MLIINVPFTGVAANLGTREGSFHRGAAGKPNIWMATCGCLLEGSLLYARTPSAKWVYNTTLCGQHSGIQAAYSKAA